MRLLTLVLLAWVSPMAHAQMFKEADLQSAYATEKLADRNAVMNKRAAERLAAKADDAQALLALAIAAGSEPKADKQEAVINQLESCRERLPVAAECHYGYGLLLGIHAMQQGMLKAMTSAGKIREAFARAVELEPAWFPARSALVEFYVQAPAVAGGGTGKARDTAKAAPKPEHTRVLEARIALADKKHDQALSLLAAHRDGGDSELNDAARGAVTAVGFEWLNDGKADKAKPVFERLAKEWPERAVGIYGLGRTATDLGQAAEAVKLLEQSAKLKGADTLPIDYRLGLAQLAQGDKDAAKAAFKRFVASKGSWSKRNLDDAKKKLEELG
jgi:flavodoxin